MIKYDFKAETPSAIFGYKSLSKLAEKVGGLLNRGELSPDEQKLVEMGTITLAFLHMDEIAGKAILVAVNTLIDESVVSLKELLEYAYKLDEDTRFFLAERLGVLARI